MPPVNHSILGASSAERWMHCTPSARLTADMADEESVYAAEGTAAHALAEWKVRKALKMQAGKRPSSDYWTDEMEECTDDYRDYIVDLVNEARKACPDPVFSVEQRLDFSCYVPDGFGTETSCSAQTVSSTSWISSTGKACRYPRTTTYR